MDKKTKSKENKLILRIVIILIAIDQILKIGLLATNTQIGNIDSWGIGIIESTKSEDNAAYILISFIAILVILRYIKSNNTYIKIESKIVLSFAVAGVTSNGIDRIWKGYVINYINIPRFTPINLSYIYIMITWIGMAIILTKYTMERINEKKQNNKRND